MARQRERLEKRAAAEEELMMRVPLAKAELRSMKAARRQAAGGALLDDFGDEVRVTVRTTSDIAVDLARAERIQLVKVSAS